ncbi:protein DETOXIFICATION 35 isoform X3 [Prunus yedoensis var. nudiflora]|uniref:Protein DETOXIFICATION 35 isoform X3 n=1 Tax=Prunus yedoensis var. nudiflora TaxID=2094558 RepID=A0A314ZQI5_PRUYE|nr:protein DETOXIFICATION 35 isoform X3 [Prunus yedoensis var. nudiflora]
MEEPLLDTAAGADQLSTKPHDLYEGGNEDYAPVRSFDALRSMFWIETVKLWKIAGPTVITMLCMYGTNSVIVIFVGHLGAVELSAVSISLSVITTFAYGFLKFLQAQRKVKVLAWIAVLGLIIQIGMLCLFILVFGWGTLGAAVAFDIVRWGVAIAQVVYIMGWCREGWTGFSWLAFKEIWAFVRLSLASAVMLCLEIWYFMSILILTGHLDNAVIAVGSLSICVNINGIELMLFIGINVAISVRVSNELGSGRPRAAKYSVYVTDLQQAVAKLAYLLGITMLLNSIQPIISGTRLTCD